MPNVVPQQNVQEEAQQEPETVDTQQPADEAGLEPAVPAEPEEPEIAFSWQASEYVHHQKGPAWYAVLAVAVIVLMAGAAWFKLWLYIGVFAVMGIAVAVYARKPPRTMMYELSSEGVHIDGRLYPFSQLRSFGVIPDEEWHSIDLEPVKRFSPRLVLLFDPEDFDEIVGHLEQHLPRSDRQLDVIEHLTRYLRF